MIREAQRALQRHRINEARVTFEQADALTWQPPRQTFDLIVTNFFLDCFTPAELQRLIPNIAAAAKPDARWLLTDFRIPEGGWTRWRAQMVHALMYRFFRLATHLSATRLTPPDAFLTEAGFQRAQQRLYNFGLLHADLWIRASSTSPSQRTPDR
jgi:ubiquinone/menaquinone biosynthesis C-methylase UbiE